jgi:uncharacterized membrane protein YfcA
MAASGVPAIQSLSTFALIYCFVVMVAAYAARGASGFGAAVAMPLLGLVMPLKILVPAWTLIAGVAGVALLGEDRKRIAWPELVKLLPGCLIGIAVGLYVFTTVSQQTLVLALGVFVLIYGFYSLAGTFRADLKPKMPPGFAAAFGGFGGGMTGATLGTLGSVFFAIYFDAVRLAKEQYRATMTAILFTLTVLRGIGYWAVGEFTYDVLVASALLLVPMLIGIFIGNRFHHNMNELVFRRTVSCTLIASGIALLLAK